MKLIFELLTLALFFGIFKVYGIYPAIASAMGLYTAQTAFMWFKTRRVEPLQLGVLFMVIILGGASLIFQNELFFKWKPSVVYGLFAFAILITQRITGQAATQKLLDSVLSMPNGVWLRLDYLWTSFFTVLAGLNLFVAYSFDTQTWVYFKLFGTLILLVVFMLAQAMWLAPYMKEES